MIQKSRRAARQRPLVRWHGGKFRLKEWILAHLPPHHCYVEPYGGGASILIHKPKSTAEIYNDLDQDIVNLFRILADRELGAELVRLVELTPYARDFFDEAYEASEDPLTRAHRLVIRSFMGHGADGAMMNYKTGFRGKARRGEAVPAQEWANYPVQLREIVSRIQSGVCIQNMDAIELMRGEDDEGVLCGYPSELYDQALGGWRRLEMKAYADGARERLEILWLNPAAVAALDAHRGEHGPLFGK